MANASLIKGVRGEEKSSSFSLADPVDSGRLSPVDSNKVIVNGFSNEWDQAFLDKLIRLKGKGDINLGFIYEEVEKEQSQS